MFVSNCILLSAFVYVLIVYQLVGKMIIPDRDQSVKALSGNNRGLSRRSYETKIHCGPKLGNFFCHCAPKM